MHTLLYAGVYLIAALSLLSRRCACLRAGFDKTHITKCEVDALRLGTNLGDVFNGPVDTRDWSERMHQNYILKHLGFAPFVNGGVKASGKTLTGENAMELRKAGGWVGHNITDSPYAALNHKWIYMFGDSTTRQLWASFAASFQGNNFERNAKEWTRQYCNKQHPHRKQHPKGGNFTEEGWAGPCGVNEVTCYVSGYGSRGLLTFDWKHFPYEDYDDHVFGDTGAWHVDPVKAGPDAGRQPDVLTLQTGLHTCWHADPGGLYSKHLTEFNQTLVNSHFEQLEKLYSSVRRVVDRRAVNGTAATQVIVVTSGSSGKVVGTTHIDECILTFNRKAARLAHEYGFAVLERGEIERRFMYKSLYAEEGQGFLKSDMHLEMPVQAVVATTLLNMITCLSSDPHKIGARPFKSHTEGGGGPAKILHSAPNP